MSKAGVGAYGCVYREMKRRLQPRYPSVAYIPDRFVVVVLSAVFTWKCGWDKQGLEILGHVKSSTGSPFPFTWPFIPSHMKHVREAMSTSFLIALLGFFESSVAAKSLGGGDDDHGDGLQGIVLSANRELVALGVANIVGGCFMSLPAFGGYGRSKVNASTGGRTPMSSIILSLISLLCVLFILPYFYYLPVSSLPSPPLPPSSPLNQPTKPPAPTESRPLLHDLRRRLLPHRRSPPRHQILPPPPRLLRTLPDVPNLPLHHLLLPPPRHRPGCRPLPPQRHPPQHQAAHPNPRQSPRRPRRPRRRSHRRLGKRRG